MYESGCIYRDNRLVNWDARLFTAVSDIEVDYIDIPGRTLINVPGYDQVRTNEDARGGGLYKSTECTAPPVHGRVGGWQPAPKRVIAQMLGGEAPGDCEWGSGFGCGIGQGVLSQKARHVSGWGRAITSLQGCKQHIHFRV
jgi:hypothetical protein